MSTARLRWTPFLDASRSGTSILMTAIRSFSLSAGVRRPLAVAVQAGLGWRGRRRSSSYVPCDSSSWLSSCLLVVLQELLERSRLRLSGGRCSAGLVFGRDGPEAGTCCSRPASASPSCLRNSSRAWSVAFLSSRVGGLAGRRQRPAAGGELAVHDLDDEQPAGGGDLVVGQVLGLPGVQPEAAGDQQQDERAEQEAALPLQARLAQQAFEGAVGHTVIQLSGSAASAASSHRSRLADSRRDRIFRASDTADKNASTGRPGGCARSASPQRGHGSPVRP